MNTSVLIVDDDQAKRALLIAELVKSGVLVEDIVEATCTLECRRALSDRAFDLLLLDLVLPNRIADMNSSAVNGLELLRQIVIDKEFAAPRSIVGVTSDAIAFADHAQEFQILTSQILFVDPTDASWRLSLNNFVGVVRASKQVRYDFDICYITALRSPELEAVLNLPYGWSEEQALGNGVLVRRGGRKMGASVRRAVCVHLPQPGPVAAAFITSFMLNKYHPRLVLMSGICGGLGDSVKVGDVVVAEKSWDWQSGKWIHEGKFESAPEQKEADSTLRSLALNAGAWIAEYYSSYAGEKPTVSPAIKAGPMVSGSSVVADIKLHDRFKVQHRKSIAVDMECYGVYFAASCCVESTPRVLCIKGVSDLSDRMKNDNYQRFCSDISAHVADKIAERYFSQQDNS